MGKMLLLFAAIALAGVAAEAPLGREYLPPSQQYGAPFAGGSTALSTQYGAPGVIGGNPALAGRYAAPGALAAQYGAPGVIGGNPALAGRYAAPGALAAQYGAPGVIGGNPALAGRYAAPGALATQYGAPSAFGIARPSAEYGVPFAGNRFGAPGSVYAPGGGYATGGYNGDYDPLAEPANYEFSYDVNDPPSGNEFGHAERRQGEVAQGRYYVVLPDGRRQVVEYQADLDGYKPQIRYEDTGYAYAAGREGYAYAGGRGGNYAAGKGGYTY